MSKSLNYFPSFGNYPAEYNRAKHGPYYPWVDYRPNKDTPFKDVKLGELKQWIKRRDKTPQAIIAAFSRYANWWGYRWLHTRYGSASKPIFQAFAVTSAMCWVMGFKVWRMHMNHKYHW